MTKSVVIRGYRLCLSGIVPAVLLLMLCLDISVRHGARAAEPASSFRIVGYLPDYRFNRVDLEHAGMLTDLILFAAEPSESGEVLMGNVANAPWGKLHSLREKHKTRLILCLGGWGKSDNFTRAVTQVKSRNRLVKSLVDVLQRHKLDGLDIDWEHPQTAEEWEGYCSLLAQLQTAFKPHGYTLSMTVAPWRTLPEKAWNAVDTVQLMSYDYGQRHSTPHQAEQDIQSFLNQKIPAGKIVLGVPFYGRNVNDRKAMTYSRIVDRFGPAADVDEVEEIYFNGPSTIRRKTNAALDSGIGGVMIWEVGQDRTGENSLLQCISETVKQRK
ncbi:glycoside hydrolase family 18 protein [Planctomicrobium sp. SH661]|uniref:glycoside hydrolase family 18 protein n=1 Tax=Planctomicrobium sp. SH661 TaxID=3448124 RepID=UPI003F5CA81E